MHLCRGDRITRKADRGETGLTRHPEQSQSSVWNGGRACRVTNGTTEPLFTFRGANGISISVTYVLHNGGYRFSQGYYGQRPHPILVVLINTNQPGWNKTLLGQDDLCFSNSGVSEYNLARNRLSY